MKLGTYLILAGLGYGAYYLYRRGDGTQCFGGSFNSTDGDDKIFWRVCPKAGAPGFAASYVGEVSDDGDEYTEVVTHADRNTAKNLTVEYIATQPGFAL